jgi:RNA polymerase sigma-70 factor (ECF subfamily)
MATETLDRLLDRLNSGDEAAAEQAFHEYEPYLRMLVRRQLNPPLRAKFDSADVVQSVWVDVLEGIKGSRWHFENRTQLRAFLARLARNRFLDRCRKYRPALACERPLAGATDERVASGEPRASELAQRDELWDRMLALCPPAHHELLRLKREGLLLSEIAARTGLHPGSVRRILYDLARRVAAAREPAESVVTGDPAA